MKKTAGFLYLLAIIKFTLPFFLQHSAYEPHRDEFLYLAEGSHPAFGYMEVPPMLSFFAWLTEWLGHNLFWIKCWPSLVGALNLVLVGRLVIDLGGKYFSLFLLFCCFFFTAFLRVHFLFQPNAFEVLFYSVIGIGLVRFIQTSENKWLYVTGIGAGLGMLSKYSVIFYLISLVPALLLSGNAKIFRNPHLYRAVLLAILIFLPNAIWQYIHHFPVIYHMHELKSTQLQYVPPSSFLKDQLLMFLPCVYIWISGFFYLLFNREGKRYMFLCWAYLGVLAILILFHGKNYYALGLYPLLFGFGALAIEQWTAQRLFFLRYILISLTLVLGIFTVFYALPVFSPEKLAAFYQKTDAKGKGQLKWEDQQDHALPQDFADMLGWEEMAQKAAAAFYSLNKTEQANTILFCDNYGLTGALNYYRKKYNLPEAISINASFLYWIPEPLKYNNLVLISDDPDEMQHHFVKEFAEARLWGTITNPYARENGTQIILLKGANDAFRKELSDIILDNQNKTRGY